MAALRADKKNYKKAFTTHANSYDKWSIGSDYSRRLLLCYCVECGLKCLIMQTDNINTVSQSSDETLRVLHSLKIDHQPIIIGRGTILRIRDTGRMQNLSKRCDCFLILSCHKCASLNIRFATVYQEWKRQSLRHVLRHLPSSSFSFAFAAFPETVFFSTGLFSV